MKPLNLKQAKLLYNLLQEHIPSNGRSLDNIELASSIIKSMKVGRDTFAEALEIMSGVSKDVFQLENQEVMIQSFLDGLRINRVMDLHEFMENLLK